MPGHRSALEYWDAVAFPDGWASQLAAEAEQREQARYQARLTKGRETLRTMEQMREEEIAERHRKALAHEMPAARKEGKDTNTEEDEDDGS